MSEEDWMKRKGITDKDLVNMLLDHLLNRVPEIREGFVEDVLDDGCMEVSFENPNYILTIKVEKKGAHDEH